MLKSVRCMNRWTAEKIPPMPNIAMISILDESGYDDFELPGWDNILYLKFRDLPEIIETDDPVLMAYRYFDSLMAKQIVDFVESLVKSPNEFHLLAHCEAGVSRSSAVAYWVSKTYGAPLPDRFEISTRPNRLVLKELFSLSMGQEINVQQRMILLPDAQDDDDESIFDGKSKYYFEFDIMLAACDS